MDQGPRLGQLIEDGDRRRDAVHVPVAAVTAAVRLRPCQHVGLTQEGNVELVGPCDRSIGIVDPFLAKDVEPGERFWLPSIMPSRLLRLSLAGSAAESGAIDVS